MWIKQENELTFTASNIEALNEIPLGNWLLKYSMTKGFYLEATPAFKFPKKIYGDSEKIAERYINTFKNQSNNLGVLLTGLKGTGKSVTAKLTCAMSNIPVILITENFTGDAFKSFLSNIRQEVVVFIDEFEKVYYDESLQNSFLSILDGIFEGKKMFIFTSNEKNKINQYMINRPGRVHYLREYDALDISIIKDVIADNLVNKSHEKGLLEVVNILSDITMDMLISLIKEMNLYDEPARESISYLNLKPVKVSYEVEVKQGNLRLGGGSIDHHPLTAEYVHFNIYSKDLTIYKAGAHNHDDVMSTIDSWREDNSTSISENFEEKEFSKSETKSKVSESAPTGEVKLATKPKIKSESIFKPSGTIMYYMNIEDCVVTLTDKDIVITNEHGTKFTFVKRTYYSFGW